MIYSIKTWAALTQDDVNVGEIPRVLAILGTMVLVLMLEGWMWQACSWVQA